MRLKRKYPFASHQFKTQKTVQHDTFERFTSIVQISNSYHVQHINICIKTNARVLSELSIRRGMKFLSKNSRRFVYVHENIISVNRFLRRLLLCSSLIHSFKIQHGFMHFLPQSSPFPSVRKIMYQIIVHMDFKEAEM